MLRSMLSALDIAITGSTPLLQSSFCPDLSLPAFGMSCLDFFLSALDYVQFEFPLPLRSFLCPGLIPLVFGMSCFLKPRSVPEKYKPVIFKHGQPVPFPEPNRKVKAPTM